MNRRFALLAGLLAAACTNVSVNQQSNALGAGGGVPAPAANVAARPAASAGPVPGRLATGPIRSASTRPVLVRASDASLGGAVPEVNQSYSGSVELLGRTIPLPEGEWTVVARDFSAQQIDPPHLGVAFVRSNGNVATGILEIYGTPLSRPAKAGFKVNLACTASEVILSDIAAENPGGVQDCMAVHFLRPVVYHDLRSSAFVHNIAAGLDARNIGTPPVMVGVDLFAADRAHELRLTAYFNPDAVGIAPDLSVQRGQSAWAPYNLAKDPQKAAYVDRVKAWGEAWRPALRDLLDKSSTRATAAMQTTP